jgi:signal transduction histidine kinase
MNTVTTALVGVLVVVIAATGVLFFVGEDLKVGKATLEISEGVNVTEPHSGVEKKDTKASILASTLIMLAFGFAAFLFIVLEILKRYVLSEQDVSSLHGLNNLNSITGLPHEHGVFSRKLDRTNEYDQKSVDEVTNKIIARDRELSEVNKRLKAIDKEKTEFVSMAAHQLRTPLTSIRWIFRNLLDGSTGPITVEQQKTLRSGLKVVMSSIALINDLLNISRMEDGRLGYDFKVHPVKTILENAFERHVHKMKEKGITPVSFFAPGLPSANMDEEKIIVALDNLLENAIKYTSPGGTINYSVSVNNNLLHISVKDSGIGVPEHEISRLFTKFFRAENAVMLQTSGTGLGLYVVKKIVEKHGGSVRIDSKENEGTEVSISLPVAHV